MNEGFASQMRRAFEEHADSLARINPDAHQLVETLKISCVFGMQREDTRIKRTVSWYDINRKSLQALKQLRIQTIKWYANPTI